MFTFQPTTAEVKAFAQANGYTPTEAKQLMYREARVRYMMELSDRVRSINHDDENRDPITEAIVFLLEREIEKNC